MAKSTSAAAKKDDAVIDSLKALMGETYALYAKTHGYHWNVTGPRFSELHDFFGKQYLELWTALDVIAERLRALGVFAPASPGEILSAATIVADNKVPNADQMIGNLAAGHETLAKVARDGVETAEDADDPVTADLMVERANASEKAAWMLRSSV